MSPFGVFSFKGYRDDDINIEGYEEYFEGRIKNPTLLDKFNSVEIQIAIEE